MAFTLPVYEVEELGGGFCVAQSPVMMLQRNLINAAQAAEAIGAVAGIVPPHPGAGAELRKAEAAVKPRKFLRDESVVEVDIVGDEDAVSHERHQAVRHFSKHRCVPHHLIGNSGETSDAAGDGTLRIDKRVLLIDHLVVLNFHRADFSDAV